MIILLLLFYFFQNYCRLMFDVAIRILSKFYKITFLLKYLTFINIINDQSNQNIDFIILRICQISFSI